jgi:hypothetical protein
MLPTLNITKNKEASIEEQEKELLYWESQYEDMFEKVEAKKNKNTLFRNLMMFNRINIYIKQ